MNIPASIKAPRQLSSLPKRWARLAHPYSLWARQLAWWLCVLGLWYGMDGGFGGAILFSALSVVCVLYALYGAPVYRGNALAWSALIILGEYYVVGNPARDWVRRFLPAWWMSKVLEVCALGVLLYSVYSGTGLGLLASALWWQAVRWWQRDQLAGVGRRWMQGFVACEIDSR